MPRAIKLIRASDSHRVVDTLILDVEQRRAQRASVVGVKGTLVQFDFDRPVALRTDDTLLLDDGNAVDVVAQAEALIEVRAASLSMLARIAWLLGDRHVPVEFLPNRFRLRRDPAIETLLVSSGGKITAIEAPFEPEGGAYATEPAHDHGHEHDHPHAHDHHDHDHAHGHEHHRHDHPTTKPR